MLVMDKDIDSAVAQIAAAHHGVFGFHHLRDLGVTANDRQHQIDTRRWTIVHDGAYRIAGAPPTWKGNLLAACWAGGTRAVASHRSAAGLWELPGRRLDILEITCPRWQRARHEGLEVHETRKLESADMCVVDGIPSTTVERTIFDEAAVCSRVVVDLAIDSALRRELTTLLRMQTMLDRLAKRGRKGTRLLRGLLDERTDACGIPESERETMLKQALLRWGLPMPVSQYIVRDPLGNFVARPDWAYPEAKLAIEYDSYQEHVGKLPHERDSARRNAMIAIGWLPLVATAEDLRTGCARLATQIRDTHRLRTLELASFNTDY